MPRALREALLDYAQRERRFGKVPRGRTAHALSMLRERLAITLLLVPPASLGHRQRRLAVPGRRSLLLGPPPPNTVLLFRAWRFAPPPSDLLVGGAVLLAAGRQLFAVKLQGLVLAVLLLVAMTWHLAGLRTRRAAIRHRFRHHRLAGCSTWGGSEATWSPCAACRDGEWWVLMTLPTVWLADSGAYSLGRRIGRHKLAPRLSPKKTWEGYLAGVVTGALAGAGLALCLAGGRRPGQPAVAGAGGDAGGRSGALTPLGDLGDQHVQASDAVKDSGSPAYRPRRGAGPDGFLAVGLRFELLPGQLAGLKARRQWRKKPTTQPGPGTGARDRGGRSGGRALHGPRRQGGGDQAAVDAMRLVLNTRRHGRRHRHRRGREGRGPHALQRRAAGHRRRRRRWTSPSTRSTAPACWRWAAPTRISTVAMAERGTMFNPGPIVYMDKIAVGPEAKRSIDIEAPVHGEPAVGGPRQRRKVWTT